MSLIEKYNVSVPRYTSYPPANYFQPLQPSDYLEAVRRSNAEGDRHLSFYLHMPFCRHLCHYCGCNSYLLPRTGDVATRYIDALHHEIDLVARHLDPRRPISQLHFGGGSPTAMPASVLKELVEHLLSLFPTIEQPEIAIECHPGYLSEQDWTALTESHFNRFSLGVQDLDTRVLKAVGRTPSRLPLAHILPLLRQAGAKVNLDFLYGLPYQTPDTFAQSIQQAILLRPDRLVTFGYGHVPWVFKRQQVLERHGLPTAEVKQATFQQAAHLLQEAGYQAIGMDHFVRPEDELYQALQEGMLYRNFQGYCTRRTTGQVYAFGVTGISQLHRTYAQNTKDIPSYIEASLRGELTTHKGYTLSPREHLVKEAIEQLMCNYSLQWHPLAQRLGLTPATLQQALHYDEEQLREMEEDGLIALTPQGIQMTESGHPYVRNVAAALDPLMQHTEKRFSKPL